MLSNRISLILNTSVYKNEDIKGSVRTRIMMTLLRDILTKTGEELNESIARAMRYLHELEDNEHTGNYIRTLMRYILSEAEDFTKENFEKIVKELTTTHKEGSEIAMTLAELLRREGFEQGIEQGVEQAKITTARNLISLGIVDEVIMKATAYRWSELIYYV